MVPLVTISPTRGLPLREPHLQTGPVGPPFVFIYFTLIFSERPIEMGFLESNSLDYFGTPGHIRNTTPMAGAFDRSKFLGSNQKSRLPSFFQVYPLHKHT